MVRDDDKIREFPVFEPPPTLLFANLDRSGNKKCRKLNLQNLGLHTNQVILRNDKLPM